MGGRSAISGYNVDDKIKQKFTGKERDLETNLDFFGARYYASGQGRFNSIDPSIESGKVENPQTWNRYNYVLNNPFKFIDPDGQEPVETTPDPNPDPQQGKSTGNTPTVPVPFPPGVTSSQVQQMKNDLERIDNTVFNFLNSFTVVQELRKVFEPIRKKVRGEDDSPTIQTNSGTAAQPMAPPAPMEAGSTKNERKINTKRAEVTQAELDEARKELETARSKPNKTPEDKEKIAKLEAKVRMLVDRLRRSPNDTQTGKRNAR